MNPPLVSPYFSLVKWAVFVQMLAIVATALYGLSFGKIQDFFQKRGERKKKELRRVFNECLSEKRLPALLYGHRLSDMLAVILEIDKEFKDKDQDSYWEEMKRYLFQTIIFPKARRLAYFPRWVQRMLAVRCFLTFTDIHNEEYILHLLKDSTPIVKYTAAYCCAKLGTPKCVYAIIEEMNHSERFLRQTFVHALVQEINKVFLYVEELLLKTEDPYTKVSCLEILSHRMTVHVVECAQRDLYASHKNLRLAAIRALGHFTHKESEELLKSLLTDPEWEVRAIAATSLGNIGARRAINELESLLKDPIWWVRMNAALALKRLGEEGEARLRAQDPDVDRYAYEIARYVLPLEIREKDIS